MQHGPRQNLIVPALPLSFGGRSVAGVIGVPDPTTVSGLFEWNDATDDANVTLVSSALSVVGDKSGNGRTASQSTSGNRPSRSALCLNGASAAGFNGTSSFLQTTSFTLAQPFTIFIAGKGTTTSSYFHDSPTGSRIAQLFASDSSLAFVGNCLFGWCGSGSGNGDTVTTDKSVDLVSCFIANGASSKMFVNNVQRGTTGQGSSTNGISSGLYIGRNQAGTFWLNGYMAHLIIYDSALSDPDRTTVQTYLKASTGITF